MSDKSRQTSAPWWKFGHMWLVLSGPAIVVVAGLYTAYLAYSGSDVVYSESQLTEMVSGDQTNPDARLAVTPALQGRNHAATRGNERTPR